MRRRELTCVTLTCYGDGRRQRVWVGLFWNIPSRDELVTALECASRNANETSTICKPPLPFSYLIQVAKLWKGGDSSIYFGGYCRLGEVKISHHSYVYEYES